MNLRKDHSHASNAFNREPRAVSFLAMRPQGPRGERSRAAIHEGRQQEDLAWRPPCSQYSFKLAEDILILVFADALNGLGV